METHLGYLSNIGGDHISWATKRHVIKIAKIQVQIQRGEQWLDSVTEQERTYRIPLLWTLF